MKKNIKMNYIYAGGDTHKETHTITVIDCFMEKLGSIKIGNYESEFDKLIKYVKTFELDGLTVIFGLEDTNGLGRKLAQYLIREDFDVRFVNSKLSSKEAKKQTTLHKADEYDSFCIAKVLVERLNEFPSAMVNDDTYYIIKQFITRRNRVVYNIIGIVNQLHVQLAHHYTNYNKFFCAIDLKSALAFWEEYPSADKLKNVSVEELTKFFRIRIPIGQKRCEIKANLILDSIKEYSDINKKGLEMRNYLIKSFVKNIKFLVAEKDELDSRLKVLVDSLDTKITTLIGVSDVTASLLLGEIGDINKFANAKKLARYSGCSPVEYSSGNKVKHFVDRHGNRKLNSILFRIAMTNIRSDAHTKKPVNPRLHEYYHKKIKEGKSKLQSIASVKRKLIDIIFKMLKENTEFKI